MNKYLKTYIRNRNNTLADVRKLNSSDIGVKHYELDFVDVDIRDIQKHKVPEVILNKNILEKYFLNQTEYKNITDYNFDKETFRWLLSVRPEYIIYFKDKLGDFNKQDIMKLLTWQPELADYFNFDDFYQGDYEYLANYDRKNGVLLKKFRHQVRFFIIANFIRENPNEYIHFVDILKERGINDIDDLIFWQPEILKHMDINDILNNLRYRDVEEIIRNFPHMRKFFEDIDYL